MFDDGDRTYTAFAGQRLIAAGPIKSMLSRLKQCLDAGETDPVLVFEDQTGVQVDFDTRGSAEDVLARLSFHPHFASDEAQGRLRLGPGRPKLGVISREISLLPRHWNWLEQQGGGVSSTLRKLVEEAARHRQGRPRADVARDAVGKFMWAMAGDLPHFEDASRALFAGDHKRLGTMIRAWPVDIRDHLQRLVDEIARLQAREG
ncbi:MAG: DUF2239 family protein [Pseudomonadota bacterium]